VAGGCQCGDEPSGSCATEFVSQVTAMGPVWMHRTSKVHVITQLHILNTCFTACLHVRYITNLVINQVSTSLTWSQDYVTHLDTGLRHSLGHRITSLTWSQDYDTRLVTGLHHSLGHRITSFIWPQDCHSLGHRITSLTWSQDYVTHLVTGLRH
jgi:hypothetical protein